MAGAPGGRAVHGDRPGDRPRGTLGRHGPAAHRAASRTARPRSAASRGAGLRLPGGDRGGGFPGVHRPLADRATPLRAHRQEPGEVGPVQPEPLERGPPLAGDRPLLERLGRLRHPGRGAAAPHPLGGERGPAGKHPLLRPRRPSLRLPADRPVGRPVQGGYGLQADRVAGEGHLGGQSERRQGGGERRGAPRRARRHPPRPRLPCPAGAVRRVEAARPLAQLRLRLRARRHPAVQQRLPRLRLHRHQLRRAPVRQLPLEPRAVQPRHLRPPGEGHQQRPQHLRAAPPAGGGGQRLPPGLPHPRLHRPGLSPLPARRGDLQVRQERLPGPPRSRGLGPAARDRGGLPRR